LLRNRNFLLLWVAQVISAAGDTFTFLALAIRIDDMFTDPGESVTALAAVLIAFALPKLLVGIIAGTLVDRLDRRVIMVISDFSRALLLPCFLILRTPSDLHWALMIGFLVATASAFFNPARTALLPALVDDEQLLTANGWIQAGQNIAMLGGSVVAGIVIASWGTVAAFWIDAATFAISGVMVVCISGVVTRIDPAKVKRDTTWSDLIEGARFASSSRYVQGIMLGAAFAMLALGAINVLFVPFLSSAFGASAGAMGTMMFVLGGGMLLGGIFLGTLGKRIAPLRTAVGSLIMLGVAAIFFGRAPNYHVALIIVPFVGMTIAPLTAALQTLLQRGVDKAMLGRASSVVEMSMGLANLISMGAAGFVGNIIGLRNAFVLGGGLMGMGAVASGLMVSRARKKDQPATNPSKKEG
jgi:DHA3 family macrolide efflux protein-like MFS transporter